MLKNKAIGLLSCLPLALMFACGAPSDVSESSLEADSPSPVPGGGGATAADDTAQSDVIATVDVGYGEVSFHERSYANGAFAISIGEQAPANYATTPLQQLLAKGHTNLEVFMALLPEREPPASFVAAHAAQASELGRESDEIRTAVFDANAPIEKSITWCKNVATPSRIGSVDYTYSARKYKDDVYGNQSLTISNTKYSVAPAICNQSPNYTAKGRVRMKNADGGSYDSPGWSTVGPGGAHYWHGLRYYEPCTPSGNNDICLPLTPNATYKLEGKSNSSSSNNKYDLYIAKITGADDSTIIR